MLWCSNLLTFILCSLSFPKGEACAACTSSICPMAEVPNTPISKLDISDKEKLQVLTWKVQHTQFETMEWMVQIIIYWFGFEPCEWQAKDALHLYNNKDVFLSSRTGSRKTLLMLAAVLAWKLMQRHKIALVIYPTCTLMDDQVGT